MTIIYGKPAPERLTRLCASILEDNAIEPWPAQQENPRALTWMMPPEVIENIPPVEGAALQMFGYPVQMEPLLGERTVALVETIAMAEVP